MVNILLCLAVFVMATLHVVMVLFGIFKPSVYSQSVGWILVAITFAYFLGEEITVFKSKRGKK